MRARIISPLRPATARPGQAFPSAPAVARTVPDGIVELPAGKIAAVATYLQMDRPAVLPASGTGRLPGPLVSLAGDLRRYRALYAEVGKAWLWFSRTVMPDDRLAPIIGDPDVQPLALWREGRDIGIVELDYRQDGLCELAFFGLVPDATGQGLGPALLDEAIRLAFARPVSRLWLHTCTLDHPAALPIYLRAGFRPFRRAIEVADDPRLSGHMPEDSAPLFPTV